MQTFAPAASPSPNAPTALTHVSIAPRNPPCPSITRISLVSIQFLMSSPNVLSAMAPVILVRRSPIPPFPAADAPPISGRRARPISDFIISPTSAHVRAVFRNRASKFFVNSVESRPEMRRSAVKPLFLFPRPSSNCVYKSPRPFNPKTPRANKSAKAPERLRMGLISCMSSLPLPIPCKT